MRLHRVIRHELEEKGPMGSVSGKLNVTVSMNVMETGDSEPPAGAADRPGSEEQRATPEGEREAP